MHWQNEGGGARTPSLVVINLIYVRPPPPSVNFLFQIMHINDKIKMSWGSTHELAMLLKKKI